MARATPVRSPASRRPPSRARLAAALLVVAAAVSLALAPMDPAWVDRSYSRGWYAGLQPLLTAASSLLPVAVLDILICAALALLARAVWRLAREKRGTRLRAAIGAFARAIVIAAAVYLLFLVCWGLNYRRQPITTALDFDRARVTEDALLSTAKRAVAELNRLHPSAHADLATMPTLAAVRVRLAPAFAESQRVLGASRLATPGRPKVSMLSPFFRWATVDGMINPLGLEVIVNPDVLPVERPFVIAHEWGHLAGWAAESEASFSGWVTCLSGDAAARYSGWLSLYWQLRRELSPPQRPPIESALAAGPRQDLRDIAARLRRGQPVIQQASWRTYDQFLKANRVDAGVRSYDEVVTLVLGTAADPAGRPLGRR